MTPEQVKQYIQAITDGLAPLGQKMQGAFHEYYLLACRQVVIEGVRSLLIGSSLCLVIWMIWRWWKVNHEQFSSKKESLDFASARDWVRAFLVIGTIAAGITAINYLSSATDDLLNSQYHAINIVLNQIHR